MLRSVLAERRGVVVKLAFATVVSLGVAVQSARAVGLIYQDANVDGPGFTNVAPAGAFSPSFTPDNLWGQRAAFGADSPTFARYLFESGGLPLNTGTGTGSGVENSPQISQTITGLTPGAQYDIYAAYWSSDGGNWGVRAGTTPAGGTYFNRTGTGPAGAVAGINGNSVVWNMPPTIAGSPSVRDADRSMYLGKVGTMTATGGSVTVFIDDLPNTSDLDRSQFDGLAYAPVNTTPGLTATINRANGNLSITNNSGENVTFLSYAINSSTFSLNAQPLAWTSITNNYDSDSATSVPTTIDATSPWAITQPVPPATPAYANQLAEMDQGGDGGVLAVGATLNLGNVWVKSPFQNVTITLNTLVNNFTFPLSVTPTYSGAAIASGDFDADGDLDLADYLTLSANLQTSVATFNRTEAYRKGDISGNGLVDFADFVAFRTSYIAINGPGSFEAIAGVPEPSTALLALGGVAALATRRRRSSGKALLSSVSCPAQSGLPASRSARRWVLSLVALVAVVSALSVPRAEAADISLIADDVIGETSFNAGLHWADGQPPVAGNNYITGIYKLRTPPGAGDHTFAGDSLRITPGTVTPEDDGLTYKGVGTTVITINNVILDGGVIHHRQGTLDVFVLAGTLHVNAPSTIWAKQGHITINSVVSGTAPLTIPAVDAQGNVAEAAQRFVSFAAANTYTGNITVAGKLGLNPTGSLIFNIGANGVNNTHTGAGVANYNGAFNFNTTGADSTLGNSWTITNVAARTFGTSFNVTGFQEFADGKWFKDSFQFDEATGLLITAPAPKLLTLRVDTQTGLASILNLSGTTLTPNYYELSSAGSALTPATWTSLDGDKPASTTTWEKSGGASALGIAETNLLGTANLTANSATALGRVFAVGGTQDLIFRFAGPDGTPFRGVVEYVNNAKSGDFDLDGDVDGSDFVVWQRGLGVAYTAADLANWRTTFGTATAATAAVPEPTTAVLVVGAALLLGRVRRRSNTAC